MDSLVSTLEYLLTPSRAVFLLGGAIVLLVPLLLHLFLSRSTPYTALPTVLLAGPVGAGKTALLTLLEHRTTVPSQTHTTQVQHGVELAVPDENPGASSYRDDLDASGSVARKFLLLDTPGHAKLRHPALAHLRPDAAKTAAGRTRAVVFVVDAAALVDADALAHTADYLYDVLLALQRRTGAGNSSRAPAAVPVLIAANKLDLFTALPAALVKSNLEAELGRIRSSRRKGLLDSGVGTDEDAPDAAEEEDNWLGEYGSEKFAFSQMREFDIDVDVVGGNVVGDGPGVDKWWRWIAERI